MVQVNATLTVADLCRRVFRQQQLDFSKISRPRIRLGSQELGHLMVLGEIGVTEGKMVEIKIVLA